jgi:CRISPR-associated endonuclease Cas3-HD
VPPERPGHPGLHAESWAAHSRAVARKIEERWEQEGASGLAAAGLLARYGLAEDQVRQILLACGLLHDVGKLQQRWQDWAQTYQKDRDPTWTATEPLAHTDYDSSKPADRDRSNRIQPKRGGHAVASAWYGQLLLARLLKEVPRETLPVVASACAVAVTAHHGGWISGEGTGLDVDKLIRTWPDHARQVIGVPPDANALRSLEACRDQRGQLAKLLEAATRPGNAEYLALVAYLSRALRLADQNATAEGGGE